jgi:hypothetical protein
MSGEIILYLENPDGDRFIVPTFDGYNVSLNLSFTDLQNFRPTGAYSDTFRSPINEEFQDFIGAIYDVNYVGWYNPKEKIPAYVTVDTIPYSQGHVEITDIIKTKVGYEATLRYFGETPDIKAEIGDLKLSELTQLSTDLEHDLDYDAVTNDNLQSGNVKYFLIDKGQNFSQGGEVGTRPVFAPAAASNPLYPSDLTPAVKARWIWDNIWSDAGFTIDSPSDFPDTLDSYWIPWYNGTIAPISTEPPNGQNFRLNLLTADEFTISAGTGFFDFSTELTESYDNGGNVSANVFTAPFTGIFRFRYWGTFNRSGMGGSSPQVQLMLRDDGDDEILNSSPNAVVSEFGVNFVEYVDLFINSGDTVKLSVYYISNGGWDIDVEGTAGYSPSEGTGMEMFEVVAQVADYTVDMALNAPEMRQYDFITSIARMHNLIIVPDKNVPNKVRIESMNQYLQSGETLDWTGKLDLNHDVLTKSTNSIQSRDLLYTYREDGDALNKIYTDEGDRIFGQLDTEDSPILTNLRSDFASGTNSVELKFAPTPCNNIIGTNVPIPKFINDKGETFKVKPRILYHAFDVDNVQVYDDDTATVTDTTCRVLSHFDNYDIENGEPGEATLDLNFGQEVYLQQTVGAPYLNLFYRYWQEYIREIYDPSARIMEAHFMLSISDFLNFDFSDVIWIKDSYWRVLEVQGYNVGANEPTKLKLIKILTLQTGCEWTPFQSNASGTITFEDEGGATGAGTQECCEYFGYTWVGSACFWNIPQGGFRPNTSGLTNFGQGSGNSAPLPSDSIAYVSNSNIQAGNFGAKYGGDNLTSGQGNIGSIMHGKTMEADDNLGAFAAFGENTQVNYRGLWFGGGVSDSDDTILGRSQFGWLSFQGEGTLTNNGDQIEIFLNANDRLSIPDETVWAAQLSVSYAHYNVATAAIDKWGQQVYFFEMHKANGVAGVTTQQIAPDHEDGNLTAHLELDFDVTTNTAQHRMRIEAVASAGLPASDLQISATLEITQVRAYAAVS